MTAHADETTREVQMGGNESSEENSMVFSPELVDEKIKVSLEPLHARITVLTGMMDRLIQCNSAKEVLTGSSLKDPN